MHESYPVPQPGEVLTVWRKAHGSGEHSCCAFMSMGGARVLLFEHKLEIFSDGSDVERWQVTPVTPVHAEGWFTDAIVKIGFSPDECSYQTDSGVTAQMMRERCDHIFSEWLEDQGAPVKLVQWGARHD